MHRVAGDDAIGQIEFFHQLLHGGNFVGLFVYLDMREHQRRVGGECAEYLSGLEVVEGVETALERLAIKRHDARAGTFRDIIQAGRVFSKGLFNLRRFETLQNIPDGRVRGGAVSS